MQSAMQGWYTKGQSCVEEWLNAEFESTDEYTFVYIRTEALPFLKLRV